ncbi:30S ribosomal protein S1, partial [Candidatus Saccharibacteria bacterium SW_7_54_9]
LKKVAKEKGWDTLQQLFESGEMFEVTPYDANRGGLLIETEGIRGFLPVSQLSAKHYPRVNNADKDQILQKLNELVQQTLRVGVLDIDRENNKLILSEKVAKREETKQQLEKLSVGDVVTGTVTGTVDFGIFVTVGGVEGLVHISEISWDRVSNPADYVEVGQEVEAKVIAIDGDKLSLSMKQLTEDPWLEQIKDYQVGDVVEGSITRVTPFGAFIQIAPAIEALVHISELGEDADPDAYFTVGETRKFRIIDIDTQVRKISLSMAEESTGQGSDSG